MPIERSGLGLKNMSWMNQTTSTEMKTVSQVVPL